jgi:hypothetical protein
MERSARVRKGKLHFVALALLLLVAAACNPALPQGDSGLVALMPFFSQELGIQGVVPNGCAQVSSDTFECAHLTPEQDFMLLVQSAVPGAMDDLVALVLDKTSFSELPEPVDRYRGKVFTWDLYTGETRLIDAGDAANVIVHLDLALAEGDSAAYIVALVVLPEAYNANPVLYDTIFAHAAYALAPLE